MATPNLSEIVTTTLYNRSRKIADNVTENNALLSKLQMKGRAKPVSGGREIVMELSHAENQTYKRYSGYELLNIAPSETLSAAVYPWKQAAVAVTISGLEQLQNSGREQMIDLLDARIEVAEATFKNNLSNDVYSDGTASGGKQLTGLQAQGRYHARNRDGGRYQRRQLLVLAQSGSAEFGYNYPDGREH